MSTKTEVQPTVLPEGRLINSALFERDAYTPAGGAPGTAKYKIEVALDPALVTGEGTIEDAMADAIAAKWGNQAADDFLDGKAGFVDPRLDGDVLAAARAEKGKEGEAYKGKIVIRADTTFNKDGAAADGGTHVYGPDNSPIEPARQAEVYSGCFGHVAVNISTYETDGKNERGQTIKLKALKFYLVAFQKTRDGDKLVKAADRSSLFKPVAGAAAQPGVRRRRAG